jgi:hypothetical protein
MTVTSTNRGQPWLLLLFSLPRSRASQRVEVWRKLQRSGALPLRSSGYVLPAGPANQEKLEWLAAAIRSYQGHASVVEVHAFDDLPDKRLQQMFLEARARDYQAWLREGKKLLALPSARRPAARLGRLRRRLQEIAAIDFFASPLRAQADALLAQADAVPAPSGRQNAQRQYLNRVWITRPRPGIDRVSSAWLIRRFIDPRARFVFGEDPGVRPEAVPFDMFHTAGFGHHGDDCTFETLVKHFPLRDAAVRRIAQIIHDADLGDGKYGRAEGAGLDRVLAGWARQDVPDDELLRRGMELIEGLYEALS